MMTKEEIIKELRDCVKENGGKTPGEETFYKNTGVGIHNRRKHWPNYGELVIEAGLIPNKFDKTKYNHQQLCEIFIEVIREKNKWPTRGVLDVKHHNDSTFPDSSTFYKKLGLTTKLAQTILEYIKDKQGYDDISDICSKLLGEYKDQSAPDEGTNITSGFVYLIKEQLRQYKIGSTDDVVRRMHELTKGPVKPELIHKIETDDRQGVEKYWHVRFEDKKIRGEWFKLTSSDVKAFKRWRKIS